ncbi:MAG: FHA domain-containing protein [bacterium]|nr:FHA domain-containing protein [bacterium]
MNRFKRKLVYSLVGLLAGALAWSLGALVRLGLPHFPSFLLFSLAAGALIGGAMGAYFGSLEGITLSIRAKLTKGLIAGALLGAVGGFVGLLVSQAFLFFLGDWFLQASPAMRHAGLPLSRALSWLVLGAFVGCIEGLRTLSWAKLKVGFLGGALGGALGGLALEGLPLLQPDLPFVGLIGLSLLGLLIGLSYGLIEQQFTRAVLRVLNGPFKGKEYLLLAKKNPIGKNPKARICLEGYLKMGDREALVELKDGKAELISVTGRSDLKVNDRAVRQQELQPNDILQVGSAKFIYYYR